MKSVHRALATVSVLLLLCACGGSDSESSPAASDSQVAVVVADAGVPARETRTVPSADAALAVSSIDAAPIASPAGAVPTPVSTGTVASPPAGGGLAGGATGGGGSGAGTAPLTPVAPVTPVTPLPPVTPVTPVTPAPPASVPSVPIAKMYITTVGGAEVVDKEEYLQGNVRIESDVAGERLDVATQIRGRGNATWGFPKKPYRLKLATATSVLGMPKEKDWALLANYVDKSLARNKLAMTLGTRMGMAWSSKSRFVELYMNGEYRGIYEVFEHVETGADRVNVEALDRNVDVDPQTITGGWLLEIDQRKGEEVCWDTTGLKVTLCVKSPGLELADVQTPGHASAVQLAYIKGYVADAEQALTDMTTEHWRDYFDVPALINWYLVNELMRNFDAKLISSVFLHKHRDGPLVFGPLWDFDIAGQYVVNDTEKPAGWWVRGSQWHQKMFDRRTFRDEVFQRWCVLKSEHVISGIGGIIDGVAATIGTDAINRNYHRWPTLGMDMTPFFYTGETTYLGEIGYLKNWLTQRVEWMDGEYRKEFGECPAAR